MTQALERPHNQKAILEPQPYKITVEVYEAMAEAGMLIGRTELIQGVIIEMPPMGNEHVDAVVGLNAKLFLKFFPRAAIACQVPVRLPPYGEPEPDFMLVTQSSSGIREASDVLLILEISDSTYKTDREDKLPIYAEHGIQDVWILNVKLGQLEVYRNPKNSVPGGWGYDPPIVCQPGTTIAPLEFPEDLFEWWT
jgi:Uma2 family endonuclease